MRRSQAGRKRARRRLTAGPCTWCGRWCDPDLPVTNPAQATWDHLLPQSTNPRMGYVDATNLVRACRGCNTRRGNRSPTVLDSGADRPSRRW